MLKKRAHHIVFLGWKKLHARSIHSTLSEISSLNILEDLEMRAGFHLELGQCKEMGYIGDMTCNILVLLKYHMYVGV